MKKLVKSALCLLLIISCSKAKNENSSESKSNQEISTSTEKIMESSSDSGRNLEGTPFTFKDGICSRKLYGEDIITLLRNHSFYLNGDPNQNPSIYSNHSQYIRFTLSSKGGTSLLFYGNPNVSENGESIYIDNAENDLTLSNYSNVDAKFTPIQKSGEPFKILLEVRHHGNMILREELTSFCGNECRLDCEKSTKDIEETKNSGC